MEIEFKTDGPRMITPCPNGKTANVGSTMCEYHCKHFGDYIKNKLKTISCNYIASEEGITIPFTKEQFELLQETLANVNDDGDDTFPYKSDQLSNLEAYIDSFEPGETK